MISTVTLNSTIDKTYVVENFHVDRIHQAKSVNIVPGGKGINVGRVFRELGGDVLLTGFVGGHNGDFIRDTTLAEGLPSDFVHISNESRTCTKIVDPINKTQTEINEIGPMVSADELDRFIMRFREIVPNSEFVVLSGSIPPSVSSDIYHALIDIANQCGSKCLLDTRGTPLIEGVKGKPYIVKPNIYELGELAGRQLATVEEAIEAAKQILCEGIEIVVVTFGKDGAIAVNNANVWRSVPPAVKFMNAVGSGDAFAAGFVYALTQQADIGEALRYGTAAGAANAATIGSGACKKADIIACLEQTKIVCMEGKLA